MHTRAPYLDGARKIFYSKSNSTNEWFVPKRVITIINIARSLPIDDAPDRHSLELVPEYAITNR